MELIDELAYNGPSLPGTFLPINSRRNVNLSSTRTPFVAVLTKLSLEALFCPFRSAAIKGLCLALTLVTGSVLFCSKSGLSMENSLEERERPEIEREFRTVVLPFLESYCLDCHGTFEPAAKLDLQKISEPQRIADSWHTWQAALSRVETDEMPPADHDVRPTEEERKSIEAWTRKFRDFQAQIHQGDPGPVYTRRLNNAEYNYTIRDITGVDIKPTETFPIDAANEAGFDNSAESLTISPALVSKYLDAAKFVAEHLVLTPDGIQFAPFTIVNDTDRDKFAVQRIVDFYQSQPTRIEDYFAACWSADLILSNHQGASEGSGLVLADELLCSIASENKLSEKYLKTIWDYLTQETTQWGPGRKAIDRWKAIPRKIAFEDFAREECRRIAGQLSADRKALRLEVTNLTGPAGMGSGSQPLILWKNREIASWRQRCRPELLDPNSKECVLQGAERALMNDGAEADRQQLIDDYQEFCSVFPDSFVIVERGRTYLPEDEAAKEAKGRLLSAGFHSMTGFFRDDEPLCDLILTEGQRLELDRLWDELRFIGDVAARQYSGFLWYERAESAFINERAFDFIRAEDKASVSDEMIVRFADAYLSKIRNAKGESRVVQAVEEHFENVRSEMKEYRSKEEAAKPRHLQGLLEFASKSYRRPLRSGEQEAIHRFYNDSLALPSADHNSAIEDTCVYILLSPPFLFRWDLQGPVASADLGTTFKHQTVPLDAYELASRLSYFLWGSAPDKELMELAERGELTNPDTLRKQVKVMLADPKSKEMLLEFLGNWLAFRRFENHSAVDRNQFPAFDDRVRTSMALEPVALMRYLILNDGKVSDLIDADYVVVDDVLSKFYGVSNEATQRSKQSPEGLVGISGWYRVDDARRYQRGGLLPMGVFLTQNSPGLRTSPVKRGYWVVRNLLGEHIPPPPPGVPELPSSEEQLGEKTLRETLELHRAHPSCSACHNRFDAAGLLLEEFDPIGQFRERDLGGRAIDSSAALPSGTNAKGIDGLIRYIHEERMDDFRKHFCESLVAFGLSRSQIISDDLLVQDMLKNLEQNGDQISEAFVSIVLSPQFRTKRLIFPPAANVAERVEE